MLSWLYDQGAVGDPSQSTSWEGFDTDTRSFYYGQKFRDVERDQAAAWLQRRGFIDGVLIDTLSGPVHSFVTDLGETVAERFYCDVKAYDDAMHQGVPNSVTWNVTGEQVQIATGDNAQQAINLGPTAEQIKLALQGVHELLAGLDLGPDATQRSAVLAEEAVADLDTKEPTGEPARRFLSWVRECVQEGGTAAAVAAVTAMSSGVLEDVERFVSAVS